MSLWLCPKHGLTGPTACCAEAGRADVTPSSPAPALSSEERALPAPFTNPAFWLCPVCGSGHAERSWCCEGYIDIPDPELGEGTETKDYTHPIVYRPEYVQRLEAERAALEWINDPTLDISRAENGWWVVERTSRVGPSTKWSEVASGKTLIEAIVKARAALSSPPSLPGETG